MYILQIFTIILYLPSTYEPSKGTTSPCLWHACLFHNAFDVSYSLQKSYMTFDTIPFIKQYLPTKSNWKETMF